MVKGTTNTGFEFEYEERLLEDYDLLKAFGNYDKADTKMGQASAIADMLDFLLGDNQERLIEHIKELNDGFKPLSKIRDEIIDMVNASKDLKNSSSSQES